MNINFICFKYKKAKDLLIKDYLNKGKNYNLRISLEQYLYVYNNKINNSTKFRPIDLFNSEKKKIG